MRHFIITGTSRGLGAALAERLAHDGNHLICISRQGNRALVDRAARSGAQLTEIVADLGDPAGSDALADRIFAGIDTTSADAVVLVNNAGTLDPIRPLARSPRDAIVRNLTTNLTAPMLLTAAFLQRTADMTGLRRIINVSSGAGRRPYAGWSCYCSAKAGLDMLTRCVALEAEQQANPVQIVSFGPGVMDTEMQAMIRSTPAEDFAQRQKFLDLRREGRLLPAAAVAEVLEALIFADPFPQGEYVDVYGLMEARA